MGSEMCIRDSNQKDSAAVAPDCAKPFASKVSESYKKHASKAWQGPINQQAKESYFSSKYPTMYSMYNKCPLDLKHASTSGITKVALNRHPYNTGYFFHSIKKECKIIDDSIKAHAPNLDTLRKILFDSGDVFSGGSSQQLN